MLYNYIAFDMYSDPLQAANFPTITSRWPSVSGGTNHWGLNSSNIQGPSPSDLQAVAAMYPSPAVQDYGPSGAAPPLPGAAPPGGVAAAPGGVAAGSPAQAAAPRPPGPSMPASVAATSVPAPTAPPGATPVGAAAAPPDSSGRAVASTPGSVSITITVPVAAVAPSVEVTGGPLSPRSVPSTILAPAGPGSVSTPAVPTAPPGSRPPPARSQPSAPGTNPANP
jgi:hypothetical protein